MTVAVLCGARSLEAIAQFARDRGPAFAAALGFARRDTPCKATYLGMIHLALGFISIRAKTNVNRT